MNGKACVSRFFLNVLFFLFALMLLSSLCRLIFITNAGLLSGVVEFSEISDILQALFGGARYDGRIMAPASLIYGLLYIVFSKYKRTIFLTVFAALCGFIVIFLSVCDYVYYEIYGDTFNSIILGLIYDDREAIFKTGMSGDYNILFRSLIVIFCTSFFTFIFYKIIKKLERVKINGTLTAFLIGVFSLYSIALLTASTWDFKGGSLDYLVTPPKNAFLRKAVPGPLRDIFVVYLNYEAIKGGSFENYAQGFTPDKAASIYFGGDFLGKEINLENLMKRSVLEGSPDKIKHIFVIIGESLSEWHFDKEFESVGLTSGLKEIASLPDGKKMPVFIQSAGGTIGTVDVMLTGLYNTDVPISNMIGRLKNFSSSPAIFKKLGYENTFYYFGSPAWRKLDRYALSQGFDKIYSMADMDSADRGVWGIYDDKGFDFVLKEIIKRADEPTFNMILTTSYHPPYDVPIKDYGVPLKKITELLNKFYPEDKRHKDMNPIIMGHAWYADKALKNFIREISEKLPDSLIVVTGDHFDRIHPSPVRDLRTRSSVPLIFYGKNIKEAVFTAEAGSHVDIIPTILELTAPKGFEYFSFGLPLLSLNKNTIPDKNRIALGFGTAASGRFIAEDNGNIEYINRGEPDKSDNETAKAALIRKNMGTALSWYIIYKGYNIQGAEK